MKLDVRVCRASALEGIVEAACEAGAPFDGVITIIDPDYEDNRTVFAIQKRLAKRMPEGWLGRELVLKFLDAHKISYPEAPTEDSVRAVLHFANRIKERNRAAGRSTARILVNCHWGAGRSASAAYAMMCADALKTNTDKCADALLEMVPNATLTGPFVLHAAHILKRPAMMTIFERPQVVKNRSGVPAVVV